MRSDKDKSQAESGLTTRQKLVGVALVLVVIIVLWQVFGLFGGGKAETVAPIAGNAPANQPPPMPQQAELVKAQPMTQRELELLKLQQETQAKYLAALNELQMLKISREIAETNQAIAVANLAKITAEKNVLNLLSVPLPQVTQASYGQSLLGQPATTTPTPPPQPTQPSISQSEVNYTVVSVSLTQYRWRAVMGAQGNLYNVSTGDILPPDGSKVISISRSGVTLLKDGVTRKISLVPII